MSLKEIVTMLESLLQTRFWGKVTVEVQDGQIIVVRREETFKQLNQIGGNTHDGSHRY
jgi:hypothetical protein